MSVMDVWEVYLLVLSLVCFSGATLSVVLDQRRGSMD